MFFKSLLDLKFQKYVTRQVASVLYAIVLGLIAIAVVIVMIGSLLQAIQGYSTGILGLLGAPVAGLVSVILVRLMFEASIALVAIAENTQRGN